jgi:hypothetical protein
MKLDGSTLVHLALGLLLSVATIGACGSDSGNNSTVFTVGQEAGAFGGASSGITGFRDGALSSADGAAPRSLYFMPATATVVVDGTTPQTARFTLVATDASGTQTDVVADSVQFDRPDLATVTPNEPVVATAPSQMALYAGVGTIHAIYRGVEAIATLTVQVKVTDYGPGLDASNAGVIALGGSSFSGDPVVGGKLLYPYDKTVWPLGLTSPLLMWNTTQAGDVYHLHYSEKNYTFDGYYTLASTPGQMRLDQSWWDRITASNDAKNAADPLSFSLSRYDGVAKVAYGPASQTWTVAPESLQGAIYYWTASVNGSTRNGHISRFRPGSGATPQLLNNGTCMGCHAVNAQGTVLVADIDDQVNDGTAGAAHTVPSVAPYDNWSGTRPWASFDITQDSAPLTYQSNKFGADVALTPDGKYLVFGGPASPAGSKYFSLGEVATGNVIATSGLDSVTGFAANETNLEMPAFSPDGNKLAVVESNNNSDRDNVIPATPETIAYLTFHQNGADGSAGPVFDPALTTIVDGTSSAFSATGNALGYPSFTPDSTAVAFHAGHTSTGCTGACDDTVTDDGNLFIAQVAGGGPVRLAAADDPPVTNGVDDTNASVEPTFNPVKRGGYSWAVFTSMRVWGNKPWPSNVTASGHVNGKRRLWVAAVDTSIGTSDPSHPAIFLEGQEDTPNMRGFWTLAACIATPPASSATPDAGACTNGFNCCSGFCKNGMCVDVNKVACSGLGGACSSAGDCCNSTAVNCNSGKCSPIVQ